MKQIRSSLALLSVTVAITALLAVVVNLALAQSFGITLVKVGEGDVAVTPGPPYTENQVVSLTANPAPGWKFVGWDTLGGQSNWWNANWNYRIPVTVSADGTQRKNKPAEVFIDFDKEIVKTSPGAKLDPNSVRVVEVDADGNLIDADVAFQFDVASTLNPNFDPDKPSNAFCDVEQPGKGTVTFIMKGTTGPNAQRTYHVYFDIIGKGIAAPAVPPQITLTDNVFDPPKPDPGSQSSYKIDTAAGTYYYQKQAAAFSSLDDTNGNDWISYSGAFSSGFGGEFRGIPNLVFPANGGHFHPGKKSSNSCVISSGPLKATIYSVYKQGTKDRIRATWEIFPTYARMTVLQVIFDYWFLYEGTPGGQLNPSTDFIVRADGTQTLASQAWSTVLDPEQWAFAADPGVNRSLFVAQHGIDDKTDSYGTGQGLMTVLGMGRKGNDYQLLKDAVPQSFSIGLIDTTAYNDAAPLVRSAYKPLSTTVGAAELYGGGGGLGNKSPVDYTITGNNTVTATFTVETYALNLTQTGQGTVTAAPNKQAYSYNDQVVISATPEVGWAFTGWTGDTSGITDLAVSPQTITMTADRTINATFLPGYTVTTSTEGQGTITLDPPGGSYLSGQSLTVEAIPESGWTFSGWMGLPDPNLNPQAVTVASNLNIKATFTEDEYTLNVTSNGNGTADWEPKETTYRYGDQVTLTATPDPGYAFIGWTGTITSPDPVTVITITGDTTATANFGQIQFYDLDILYDGEGSVALDPALVSYPDGTVVKLTATADPDWIFSGWSGDVQGSANPAFITMTKNSTVTATFIQGGPFELNVTTEGQGSVTKSPQKTEYAAGEEVTLTAAPLSGWIFSNWKGDLTGSANPVKINMTADKNITAVFILPTISGPASDNFDACVLDDKWTFVNPFGVGAVTVNHHRGVIDVPADVAHEVFTTGNNGVRIIQATENEDFAVEVKFESRLQANGTGQGLVVEQDAQNFMRFDFFRRNDAISVFAGAFQNLSSVVTLNSVKLTDLDTPLYVRVVRTGDTWEMLYSVDGATWNSAYIFDHSITVQQVGIFAGNFKVKTVIPPHTAAFDYFYNLTDPVKPGDQSLLTVNVLGNGQVQRAPAAPYTCGQSVTLTAVPNSGAQFIGWAGDATGTTNPLALTLNTRKVVTAEFGGGTESFRLALPMVIAP
jgi:uncharacterized repeat protein (TIGR02543 family)